MSYGPKWFGRKPVKRYDLTLTANNSSSDDFETSHYGHSVRCQISNIDSDDKLKTFFLYDNRISGPVQMEANDKKNSCRYHYSYTSTDLVNDIVGSSFR